MKISFLFFLFLLFNFLNANEFSKKLTKEELDFLQKSQPLRLHNEQYWPPYNFNENGVPKGFMIDYLNLISKKTNIKIQYISGPSWNEFMEMLKTDQLDAIINIAKNDEREKFFNFTNTFHSASNAIYVKKGNEHLDSLEKITQANLPCIHLAIAYFLIIINCQVSSFAACKIIIGRNL